MLFTVPEGWLFQYLPNQLNKMKKVTLEIKNATQYELCLQFTNISRILSSAFLRFCCKFSKKIIFLPTSKHRQAKVRRLLSICLYDCFIYSSDFVFRKCLETRRHLGSGRKTVNSQGYSELRGPIQPANSRCISGRRKYVCCSQARGNQNAQKLLFTDLVNT